MKTYKIIKAVKAVNGPQGQPNWKFDLLDEEIGATYLNVKTLSGLQDSYLDFSKGDLVNAIVAIKYGSYKVINLNKKIKQGV